MKKSTEHQNFTRLVDRVLSVPHADIKAKLEEEKKKKALKKKGKYKNVN